MPVLSPEQLVGRLARGKPVGGILLLGAETFLRDLCARKIAEAYVSEGAREWGITRFSAEDDSISSILGQAQTLPMLAPRHVIFVSDVEAWERLGDDSREALVAQLSAYLDDPAPFSVMVFEADALDRRMRLGKVLLEKTLVVSAELSGEPAERARLAATLALDMAHDAGVTLEDDAAEELAEIFNGDLTAIHTELDKLATYVGDCHRVTLADVELLAVSERKHSTWELTDKLASRQPSLALEFLDSLLREGEKPPALIGALAWMYRKLLEAQELPAGISAGQAAGRLGVREGTAELVLRQSRKFPRTQLARGLVALYEADSRLKSGGTSQRGVLEFLIAQLASAEAEKTHA